MTPETTPSLTAHSPSGLVAVAQEIARACKEARRDPDSVTLIAVSKTFDAAAISPIIAAGQRVFGENRVQEAKAKWPALVQTHPDIVLHLIGPLQSNKAKEAVALFDAIHSVDRPSHLRGVSQGNQISAAHAGTVRPAQHRRGAAEGGHRARRGRRLHRALPREIWPDDLRPDVHPAGERRACAAFRADGENRRAERADKIVDGHERRFCGRDRDRRDPCARRFGDFRGAVAGFRCALPFSSLQRRGETYANPIDSFPDRVITR